jgi:hypothetical protein
VVGSEGALRAPGLRLEALGRACVTLRELVVEPLLFPARLILAVGFELDVPQAFQDLSIALSFAKNLLLLIPLLVQHSQALQQGFLSTAKGSYFSTCELDFAGRHSPFEAVAKTPANLRPLLVDFLGQEARLVDRGDNQPQTHSFARFEALAQA